MVGWQRSRELFPASKLCLRVQCCLLRIGREDQVPLARRIALRSPKLGSVLSGRQNPIKPAFMVYLAAIGLCPLLILPAGLRSSFVPRRGS